MTQTLLKPVSALPSTVARHWINRFEITNLSELILNYRLLGINLPETSAFDKQINQLAKRIAFDIRQPVALIRKDDKHWLAIPTESPLPKMEVQLGPCVAQLSSDTNEYTLALGQLDVNTTPIAAKFLEFVLRAPLMRDPNLWSYGRHYYKKQPLDAQDARSAVDLYPGFCWSVVTGKDGRLFVAVDTSLRFVDRNWLTARYNKADAKRYQGSNCLYHFGHQWYVVKLKGITDTSLADQRFTPNDQATTDVFSYTRDRWHNDMPEWVRNLDPVSPAIIYSNPGKDDVRHGALALCKRMMPTNEIEAARRHHETITPPNQRFDYMETIISKYFQDASLSEQPIRVSAQPLEVPRRIFTVPAQLFGNGRVVGVCEQPEVTNVVSLAELGRKRLDLLQDPYAGCLDKSSFLPQYLLMPQSLDRSIRQDTQRRYERIMQIVSGQQEYHVTIINFDDRQARGLYQQVQAVKTAISKAKIQRGYGLLILPEQPHPDLHNALKRKLWKTLQFQCAHGSNIRAFYHKQERNQTFAVAPDKERKYSSYMLNLAFGSLIVNRKWPWALNSPLHYDVTIGIDVLNFIAGMTFVYDQGKEITFLPDEAKQKERLTTKQVRHMLLEGLGQDLKRLSIQPRSIIIHRDGRTFTPEIKGVHQAIGTLKAEGLLPENVLVGIVDIRKTSTEQARLVEGTQADRRHNPIIGSYNVFDARNGIVCTTGLPFKFDGTAKPLSVVVTEGDLNMEWVLEDIFCLSQLVFSAPDKCQRLPVTIKIADDFLEPIASAVDEEALRYDAEDEEEDEED